MILRLSMLAFLALGITAALFALQPDPAAARATHRKATSVKHAAAAKHARRSHVRRNAAKAHRRSVAKEVIDDTPIDKTADGATPPQKRPRKILTRAEILASDPARLERLGRRLIVGFESYAGVKALVERKAVSGIFITDHNVRRRSAADVAKNIQRLQDIRKSQGLPRLIVAADQEGGYVSRLSPPLKRQPSLGKVVAPLKTDADREKAVRAYAETQAHELERLGVTMNFGPVVDLRLGTASRNDGETRTYWRAISSDPYIVAQVADWYCDTLTRFNIICTLKHFPGLGRVARDTHVSEGRISTSESKLELNDWLPFRRVMSKPGVATMIGHVRVADIDNTTPASYSDVVVNSVVRSRWQGGGSLLITDDLTMGAVIRSRDGIGGAAVKAVNAGIDLVLVSFSEKYFDTVMSALIEADMNGEIDQKRQSESRERLSRYVFIDDRDPTAQARQ